MGAQLSKKAALPLAKILATSSCCSNKTVPWALCVVQSIAHGWPTAVFANSGYPDGSDPLSHAQKRICTYIWGPWRQKQVSCACISNYITDWYIYQWDQTWCKTMCIFKFSNLCAIKKQVFSKVIYSDNSALKLSYWNEIWLAPRRQYWTIVQ